MEYQRHLTTIAAPDVLVCGAGCAGVAAAVAAARSGASTVVIDRLGYAGGYMTAVGGAGLDGFIDLRSGFPIVGGLVFEFVRRAGRYAGDVANTSFHASDDLREWQETPGRTPIGFDLEIFKTQADNMLVDSGARILYHTQIVDVLRHDRTITGVVVANKGGIALIQPKYVVDATGDADVAAWGGADFDMHSENQPMGLHFRVAGARYGDDIRERCATVLEAAHRAGVLGVYGGPWISLLGTGELNFNATRIPGSGLDPEDITQAEIRGRADAHLMFRLFKEQLTEFAEAHLILTGPSVGVRETRRIRGVQTLTLRDIEGHSVPDDTVTMGAWWLDRHPPSSSGYHVHALVRPYGIRYGTLITEALDNLWVAGRCHSAESAALASSRVTITAMGLGQAAGTAAALASRRQLTAHTLSTSELTDRLLRDGVIIGDRAHQVLAKGDALGVQVPESRPR